jgi:DNA-binding MarR family transcriptional regulator
LNIEKEGTPSTSLGPKMGMEPTSLSRTLKNMEAAGIITRRQDKVDKRKSLVFLTPEGVERRKMARDVVLGFNQRVYEQISKSKVKAFFEVMQQLDDILSLMLDENRNPEKEEKKLENINQ